jgi:hypothetical protein
LRESRKIEDIILPFVTTATKALKKDEELADGAWKWELNAQISLFLELLSDSLASLGQVPVELTSRLEGYRTRLKADPPPPERDKDKVESQAQQVRDAERMSVRSGNEGIRSKGMEGVAKLWGMNEDGLQQKSRELQNVCTEQAALEDLKVSPHAKCSWMLPLIGQTILKLLNTDQPFPYGPSDFSDHSQWSSYRTAEVSTLSQMMLLMMQSNPSLTQSSDRYSNGDLSARMDGLKLNGNGSGMDGLFTYIPPDPRQTYRDLLARCLDWDLEVLKTLPEDEDVSLSVLSQEHVALLGECAVRWRLPASFRSWVFLEAIVDRCEQGLVPAACVHEATAMLAKVSQETSIDTWAIPDVSSLRNQLRALLILPARRTAKRLSAARHLPALSRRVRNHPLS